MLPFVFFTNNVYFNMSEICCVNFNCSWITAQWELKWTYKNHHRRFRLRKEALLKSLQLWWVTRNEVSLGWGLGHFQEIQFSSLKMWVLFKANVTFSKRLDSNLYSDISKKGSVISALLGLLWLLNSFSRWMRMMNAYWKTSQICKCWDISTND